MRRDLGLFLLAGAHQLQPYRVQRCDHVGGVPFRPLLIVDAVEVVVLVAAPSTTLRVVPLPRFTGEDS